MQKIINFICAHSSWSLLVILFIALIFRVILIDKIPGGLQGDESLILYNAWSIAETGADIFNDSLPVHLRGYGWGENSFLVYLLVPLIKLFGPFQVSIFRLVVVLFHLLLILFSFFLARELFDEKVGLLTALFLTFSPWDLALSRILFNVSLLPCFYIAGLYFLIVGLKRKRVVYFMISGFILSLTFYIYALSYFWVPILVLITAISFWPKIKALKYWHFLGFTLTVLIIGLPIILFYIKNQFGLLLNLDKFLFFSLPKLTSTRFNNISILNEIDILMPLSLAKNYLAHFNPVFLFFNATLPSFVKHFGLIQLYELPFLVIGLVLIFINSRSANYKFLILWLLAASLPVALTIENLPHPLRFVSALPIFEIIASLGIIYFFTKFITNRRKILMTYIVSIAIIVTVGSYFFNYYVIYPQTSFREQQAGSQELTEFIQENYNQYTNIYIVNRGWLYLYFPYNYLYFARIQPQRIQALKFEQLKTNFVLDKINFVDKLPVSAAENELTQDLYLLPIGEAFDGFIKSKQLLKEFKDLNNQTYFVALK